MIEDDDDAHWRKLLQINTVVLKKKKHDCTVFFELKC